MNNSAEVFSNPGGRAIAVLDSIQQAEEAKQGLSQIGLEVDEIHLLNGKDNADSIDASAKWFADTDDLLERYQRKLEMGKTLISAPVENNDQLKQIQAIYYAAGAETMTNFGSAVTRTIDLSDLENEHPIDDM